jgi:hypothetical protein
MLVSLTLAAFISFTNSCECCNSRQALDAMAEQRVRKPPIPDALSVIDRDGATPKTIECCSRVPAKPRLSAISCKTGARFTPDSGDTNQIRLPRNVERLKPCPDAKRRLREFTQPSTTGYTTGAERRVTRGEGQETRGKRQETRDERQEARDKRQETRGEPMLGNR